MQKIPVKLAAPGMKLAKPVTRDNGMVVLPKGWSLLKGLSRNWSPMDVERIVVKGNPVNLGDNDDSSWSKKSERLDHLSADIPKTSGCFG